MDPRQAQALLELADINLARSDAARAASFYARHRSVSGRPTPRSLLLGIRIARATGERDAEASYVVQLKGLYPNSAEYREYQAKLAGAQ
jgi:type IV pilus assembly protein PilF